MRFIAVMVVVAIIVVGVLIYRALENRKAARKDKWDALTARFELAQQQNTVMFTELKTIRDLQGDSAFTASVALEEVERLRENHYKSLERA